MLFVAGALACSGCSYVPSYDLPDDNGEPTVASIVARIECELTQMVAAHKEDQDVGSYLGNFLLEGNYDVEASLSVEVNDTGGLAPSITSIVPYHLPGTSLSLGATANLSASRDQTFTESLRFNMRQLHEASKNNLNMQICKAQDTPLAGELGLADFVAMAANNQTGYGYGGKNSLDVSQGISSKGAFGGAIKFVITKGVSSAGPTWTLSHFKGPGGLASFSRVNTDSLTIAFARHAAAGGAPSAAKAPAQNQAAHELVQLIIFNSIASGINILNAPR